MLYICLVCTISQYYQGKYYYKEKEAFNLLADIFLFLIDNLSVRF